MNYGYIKTSRYNSSSIEDLESQELEIRSHYDIVKIYKENYYKSNNEQEVLEDLIKTLKKGDTLVITTMDKIGTNIQKCFKIINQLYDKKVIIHILNMGKIKDDYIGKIIYNNLVAFSEFEKNRIVTRTQRGKYDAKKNPNFKEGRPRKFDKETIDRALGMLSVNGGKYSYNEVSEIMNISRSTLMRRQTECKEQLNE